MKLRDVFEYMNTLEMLEAFQNGEHLGSDSEVTAYKLFKQHKDGSLRSLFINKHVPIPTGQELEAENHPTKGFSERFGWHGTHTPVAPHLDSGLPKQKGRVWAEVKMRDVTRHHRPENQGGQWYTSRFMTINKVLHPDEVADLRKPKE